MRKLSEYINLLRRFGLLDELIGFKGEILIDYLTYTSRNVRDNTLFVCKGSTFKEEYLQEAKEKGALAYVSTVRYSVDLPCILVSNVFDALSVLAQHYFDYPRKDLKLIGITGTKGKSTTTYYINSILNTWLEAKGEKPCAIISTIETDDGHRKMKSVLTTPESLDLQRHFYNAVASGRKYCVCECSSQAFKYGRLFGVQLDMGLLLNISEDHISPGEHSDFEDYFSSKLKIFKGSKACGYNSAMDNVGRVENVSRETFGDCTTFGFEETDTFYGYDIKNIGMGTSFKVRHKDFDAQFTLPMPGIFNVENALGAICACHQLGVDIESMQKGLEIVHVDGRMELYSDAKGRKLGIVDYAHNELSMQKLLESVKQEYPTREISMVFGSVGDRAPARRRELGLLSGIHAHRVYITEDDPGSEETIDICREIEAYSKRNCENVFICEDRAEAVRRGVFESSDNALILLLGKGNEGRQKRKGRPVTVCQDKLLLKAFLALWQQENP